MPDLKTAITITEVIIAALVTLVLGDYLSYKFGHRRIAIVMGVMALAVIVLFAIYAAIVLRSA